MLEGDCFVIWGSAGHAKVLSEIIALQGGTVLALFDNNDVPSVIPGVVVYKGESGFRDWLGNYDGPIEKISGLAAIGGCRGRDRLNIQKMFQAYGLKMPPIKHPLAAVSQSVNLGFGTQVLALANIAAESQLGDACIVNHRATIDHECELGHGVHVGPGATLCGCVKVANNVFIGAGAVVLPRISIGENSFIGAGAVVTKNIPPGTTVVGSPAMPIRKNE